MPNLVWYAGRAAAVSPREMVWRTQRIGQSVVRWSKSHEQSDSRMLATSVPDRDTRLRRFGDGTARPVLLDRDRASRIAERPAEVKALLAHRRGIARRGARLSRISERQHRCRRRLELRPDHRFSLAGYRRQHDQSPGGTQRPEMDLGINRLQHLPVVAQGWLFTGESRNAGMAFDHLASWLDQNQHGGRCTQAPARTPRSVSTMSTSR